MDIRRKTKERVASIDKHMNAMKFDLSVIHNVLLSEDPVPKDVKRDILKMISRIRMDFSNNLRGFNE